MEAAAPVELLAELPELGSDIPPSRHSVARQVLRARVLRVPEGRWRPPAHGYGARGGHGLLVLSGLVIRSAGKRGRSAAELLGRGDLVRPWQDLDETRSPSAWRVLQPLRLAVVDRQLSAALAEHPEVAVALTATALRRARALATTLAITRHPRAEDRLLLLLWYMAERFGTPTADGVNLAVPATHEILGQMIGIRRPAVTLALGALERRGLVLRQTVGWRLLGSAPSTQSAPLPVVTAAFEHARVAA